MPTVRLGRRGQLTIPFDVRRDLGLHEGEKLIMLVRESEILLRPTGPSIFALRGSIPVSAPQDFSAIRKETLDVRAAEKAKRTSDE